MFSTLSIIMLMANIADIFHTRLQPANISTYSVVHVVLNLARLVLSGTNVNMLDPKLHQA